MARLIAPERSPEALLNSLDHAPKGKELSALAASNAFHGALDATAMVTIRDICGLGVVSRKTVMKHIASQQLSGAKALVGGKETWLFEPVEARRYLTAVADLIQQAVRSPLKGSKRVEARDGWMRIDEVAAMTGLSTWTIRDAIRDGALISAAIGANGTTLIEVEEAKRWARSDAPVARGAKQRPRPARPHPIEHRAIVISNRLLLLWVVLDQPAETKTALARDLGVGVTTLRRWADGESVPDDISTGKLVVYARGRYKVRVADELAALAASARRDYQDAWRREKAAIKRAVKANTRRAMSPRRFASIRQELGLSKSALGLALGWTGVAPTRSRAIRQFELGQREISAELATKLLALREALRQQRAAAT